MTLRRLTLATLLSAAACVVLATRVFTSFDAMRVKLVEQRIEAADGLVRVESPPGRVVFEPPYAVIARIRNNAPSAERFTIRVNGIAVCDRAVAPQVLARIDCSSSQRWAQTERAVLTLSDGGASWSLEYLELATHHGATRNYDLIVIPGSSSRYQGVGPFGIALAFALLLALQAAPPPPAVRPGVTSVYRGIAAAVTLFLILVLLSRLLSSYSVLLSVRSFVVYVGILFAPQLWSAYRRSSTWVSEYGLRVPLTGAIATLAVLTVYGAVFQARLTDAYHGNYSGFLQLSRAMYDRNPILNHRDDIRRTLVLADGGGYDGQFFYFEVYDPFLRRYGDTPAIYRQFLDAPPYRFGRIGYSLMAKVFSMDRWELYARTMVWLVFLAIALCAVALGRAAADVGVTPAWAGVIVLIPGFWQSLQSGLPEPIAAATLLGGYVCASHRRWYCAAALCAMSLLVRETGLIFVVIITAAALRTERTRDVAQFLVLSLTPLLVWRLYVGWVLYSDWGADGVLFTPVAFAFPFKGIVQLWATIGRGEYYPTVTELSRAGTWYPVLVTAAAAFACTAAVVTPSAASIAAVFYAVLAICLNFTNVWVHVGNAERASFELFVMLGLVSLRFANSSRFNKALALAFWVFAGAYVFYESMDAQYFRDALSSLFPAVL